MATLSSPTDGFNTVSMVLKLQAAEFQHHGERYTLTLLQKTTSAPPASYLHHVSPVCHRP